MNREELFSIADKVGLGFIRHANTREREKFELFTKLVTEHEREACAEICDGFYLSWIDIQGRYEFMGEGASECAGAIRARGQT